MSVRSLELGMHSMAEWGRQQQTTPNTEGSYKVGQRRGAARYPWHRRLPTQLKEKGGPRTRKASVGASYNKWGN